MLEIYTPVQYKWESILLQNALLYKYSIESGDFSIVNIRRAQTSLDNVDYVSSMRKALDRNGIVLTSGDGKISSDPAATVSKEIENISVETCDKAQNSYQEYDTAINELKTDQDADKDKWQDILRAKAEELKKKLSDGIDMATATAIKKIELLPPAARSHATNYATRCLDATMGLAKIILDRVTDLLDKVGDFFRGIWDSVVNAYSVVIHSVGSTISFIRGIFSAAGLEEIKASVIDKLPPVKALSIANLPPSIKLKLSGPAPAPGPAPGPVSPEPTPVSA